MSEYKPTSTDMNYHYKQLEKPYRSTEVFVEWLEEKGVFKGNILDVGSGGGGNIKYMSHKFPGAHFTGIEFDNELVDLFNSCNKSDNARMVQGDAYKLDESEAIRQLKKVNGVISFQFLSCIPELEPALDQMAKTGADWIAASSLFFDGKVQYKVIIEDYNFPMDGSPFFKGFQHVYAMDVVKEYFCSMGYTQFDCKKYDIDIDLPNANPKYRGTYTVKTEDGARLQISANMLMPWYFIFAAKQ